MTNLTVANQSTLYLPPGTVDNAVWLWARQVQDSVTQARAAYWLRRAEVWEDARPRAGDYFGNDVCECAEINTDPEAEPVRCPRCARLKAADERCAMTAQNCRNHARLLSGEIDDQLEEWRISLGLEHPTDEISPEVWAMLEVAAA